MIYLWEDPKNCTNKMIAEYERDISPDRFLFMSGTPVEQEKIIKPAVFKHRMVKDKISSYDCIPNNSASPLVNQRIIDLLLEFAPDDVQLIDAEIHCKDGVLTHYKLLNVISTFIGIDYEKSICTRYDGIPGIMGFKYLVFKQGALGSHQVARNEEYKGNLVVSEKIKRIFEKEKIKGVWFVPPEELYTLLYSRH